jgi:hypothetical protein
LQVASALAQRELHAYGHDAEWAQINREGDEQMRAMNMEMTLLQRLDQKAVHPPSASPGTDLNGVLADAESRIRL